MSAPAMSCPNYEQLRQLYAGTLPATEAQSIEGHLPTCAACRQRWQELLDDDDPFAQALQSGESRNWPTQSETVMSDTGEQAPFLQPPRSPGELGWLGDYRVLRVLGTGGMGIVYEAEDTTLQRRVALKVMRPALAAKDHDRQRFLQEARLAAALPPDHIATIYQVGMAGEVPFIAMQYLEGESLESRLERPEPLPWPQIAAIARQTAEGLAVAHAHGLVHRDIKPANIWLEKQLTAESAEEKEKQTKGSVPASSAHSAASAVSAPRVRLLDFGLTRAIESPTSLTTPGMVVGTPQYMSPEQARAGTLDGRSDLFSLGIVLYQMIARRLPFNGSSVMAIMTALAVDEPKPLETIVPDVPPGLARLVHRLLAKQPADRPADAAAVVAALRALEAQLTAPPPPPAPLPPTTAVAPLPSPSRSGRPPWFSLPIGLGVLAIVLTVAALILFGPGTSPRTSGPPAPTDPIKVGVLFSFSGTMGPSEAPVADATILALEQLNRQGGVLNRQLQIVTADGASDGPTFAQEAEKLLTQERVAVIFGCYTSFSRKSIKGVVERLGGVLFYPVADEGLEESPRIVYTGGVPNQQVLPGIDRALELFGAKKIFLAGSDSVYSHALHAIVRDHLKERNKTAAPVEVVGTEYLPVGGRDAAPLVAAIRRQQPDLIVNMISGSGNVYFFRALRAAGLTPQRLPTISCCTWETELLALDHESTAGDYAVAHYFQSIDRRENRRFIEEFRERFDADRVLSDPMEAAYCGVFLWANAVKQAGAPDADGVLQAVGGQTFDGPGGTIRIDPDTQHAWKTARLGKIRPDGQFEIVYTSPQAIRPQPFPPTRTRRAWELLLNNLYLEWGNQWAAPARP